MGLALYETEQSHRSLFSEVIHGATASTFNNNLIHFLWQRYIRNAMRYSVAPEVVASQNEKKLRSTCGRSLFTYRPR